MQNAMAVTAATDAHRASGVPISLKWLSFSSGIPTSCSLSQPLSRLRFCFKPQRRETVMKARVDFAKVLLPKARPTALAG